MARTLLGALLAAAVAAAAAVWAPEHRWIVQLSPPLARAVSALPSLRLSLRDPNGTTLATLLRFSTLPDLVILESD
jgi:hypothetical protein